MQTFKTEKTFTMIKWAGKLRHIETLVTYACEPETDPPDFDYGNVEGNKKELERFKCGELENYCVKVSATALGETGTDYLGQCFVLAKDAEKQLQQTIIEHDMKNNACIELRNNIIYQYEKMKSALECGVQ